MRKLLLGLLLFTLLSTSAFGATWKRIQTGTISIGAGSASNTATITSVDTAKTFVIGSYSLDNPSPDFASITVQLTNATTVTAARATATASPAVTVRYYAMECITGCAIQRGSQSITVTSTDVTLTTVDTAKAIAISYYRNTGLGYSSNDWVKADITTSTNLNLSITGASASGTAEWQVVELTDSSVQTHDFSFITTDGSKTQTITSVNTGKSWLLYSYNISDTGSTAADIGQKMIRCVLTDSTTITCDRNNTGNAINVTTFVVTFTDGTTVQKGTEDFSTTETAQTVTILQVDPGYAFPVGGGFEYAGGRTAYAADDNPGTGMFDINLSTSTSLVLTRAQHGSATADFGWFVIALPLPPHTGAIGSPQ